MKVDIVVDVGNSRIKWGRCEPGRIVATASLPHDESTAWVEQLETWGVGGPVLCWAVSSVRPQTSEQLVSWLRQAAQRVFTINNPAQLALEVALEHPEHVGIDRLLNAVAVNSRPSSWPGCSWSGPRIIIDAGTAVTVDLVDHHGRFLGGTIFPGFRLMAQALHEYTALLPLVEVRSQNPPLPGHSTPAAIEAGVYWAVAGGIKALIRRYVGMMSFGQRCGVFLTGGSGLTLLPALEHDVIFWPEMTLEGIRLAAEALPESGPATP